MELLTAVRSGVFSVWPQPSLTKMCLLSLAVRARDLCEGQGEGGGTSCLSPNELCVANTNIPTHDHQGYSTNITLSDILMYEPLALAN